VIERGRQRHRGHGDEIFRPPLRPRALWLGRRRARPENGIISIGAMPSRLPHRTRLLDIPGRPLQWSVTDLLDEDFEDQREFVVGRERRIGHGDTVVQIFLAR
jgi:hypothetical protein